MNPTLFDKMKKKKKNPIYFFKLWWKKNYNTKSKKKKRASLHAWSACNKASYYYYCGWKLATL